MIIVDKAIHVDVPVSTVYQAWTTFEAFPRFMQGVIKVQRINNMGLYWRANYAGVREDWHAEIVDVQQNARVAWHSLSSRRNDMCVTFVALDAQRTRVNLHLEYEAINFLEDAGSTLGAVARRVESDLLRFKNLIEGLPDDQSSANLRDNLLAAAS